MNPVYRQHSVLREAIATAVAKKAPAPNREAGAVFNTVAEAIAQAEVQPLPSAGP